MISARDRCDYTIDRIRTVRSKRYRYIRNYYPHRPLMQPGYRDGRPASVDMHRLYKLNKLTKYQADHWFGIRPTEELYDMQADPHQMINLSMNNAYNKVLIEHRNILLDWIEKPTIEVVIQKMKHSSKQLMNFGKIAKFSRMLKLIPNTISFDEVKLSY